MTGLTTHVLDTALGRPAEGLVIALVRIDGDRRETLKTVTTNSDGRIATDELRTWIHGGGLAKNSLPLGDALSGLGMANAFQTLDLNGDGRLSTKEAGMQTRLRTGFRAADGNRDGYLTQAEYDAWSSARKH